MDNTNHYVTKEELLEEIAKSKKQDKLTDKLAGMLFEIAKGSNRKLKYKYESDKEDCIMGALEILLNKWDKFDLEKGNNPFAYYTQIAKNGFAKTWKDMHKIKTSDKISINNNFDNI